MATLYESAGRVRKGVVAFILLSILLTIFGIISGFFNSEKIFVDPEANRYYQIADIGLGQVPALEIPGITYTDSARFDQQSAHTEILPDVAILYSIEKPRQKLLSVERAEEVVSRLGFTPEARLEGSDPNILTWTKENGTRTLIYNKVKQEWDLTTNYRQNPSALQRKSLTDLDSFIQRGVSTANRLGFDSFGFDSSTITATYTTRGVDGIFRDTLNQADANYAFIEISREIPLANIKTINIPIIPEGFEDVIIDQTGVVYSDDPRYGQIHIIASGDYSDVANDTFELEFTNFEYDLNNTGVYPITTPDEAWVNIQKGQGSLVFIQPQGENYYGNFDSIEVRQFTADFRETKLGYWEPMEWTGFVTPIYVFKGTATLTDGKLAEFIFYVDALKRV